MLDRPWWTIVNNTDETITVSNAEGSDVLDINEGEKGSLMRYGTDSFFVTFPDGTQYEISTLKYHVKIEFDSQGNLITRRW